MPRVHFRRENVAVVIVARPIRDTLEIRDCQRPPASASVALAAPTVYPYP